MITYRIGNQKDVSKISKLLIDTWANCYKDFIPSDFLNNLNLDKQIQRHTKYMTANTKYFVAENEFHQLIGFTSYGKNRNENINCEIELYTLYVDMNYQGKGIGKSLLNSILSDLKNIENNIVVSVFEKNPFKKFYTKNGFTKIGEEIIDMGEFELMGEIYMK